MNPSIKILRKLRNFQLEQEEMKLKLRQTEEDRARMTHRQTVQAIQNAIDRKASLGFGPEFISIDFFLKEASANEEEALEKLEAAKKVRAEQIEHTLHAKRRLDMIDRVIQHRLNEENLAADMKERKILDDVSQAQFMLTKPERIIA